VTTADVTDRNGALAAMDRCKPNLESVQSVLVDGGYTGQPFADGVMERLKATVQVVKRNELHTFAVLPKRWVVERSFGWLESAEDCGRTANANSIPACSSFTSPSSYYYSEDDRKQALTSSSPHVVQDHCLRPPPALLLLAMVREFS